MILKSGLFSSQRTPDRISHEDEDAVRHLSSSIQDLLPRLFYKPIVVLCIGTDRSTGDSLGPLTGTKLMEKRLSHFHVYGTLKDPVHAVNLQESVKRIKEAHRNPFIIAIDACLGRIKNVGTFQVGAGPIKPGSGVNKELPAVGDIHINGIVNVSGFMEFFVLQNTRLHLVMTMSDIIAESLYMTDRAFARKKALFKPAINPIPEPHIEQ
ncbi:spore protease YyaC [Metabacillus arenae]|uniref:Spore protease YyaC n=1 Tax=Metabacillus arenae TaxID=2771434 RepID=A0A926NL81_9BACI|nr:spore protease YyaC [Metabacillus arenae]MBD1379851.1 spore protease YyaC [Metabacillus arenae]